MSSITFEALIDSVHIDPKKGVVKIALVALSHVSLDKLTTLGPKDESVRVRLESEQTKLPSGTDDVIDETNGDLGPFSLGERAAEKLKEAAERLSGEDEE